jgi:V/A-type H+-transporting ATPase subunit A
MVPFHLRGALTVAAIAPAGEYTINETIAELADEAGVRVPVQMSFHWPVKRPVTCYRERLRPSEPLVTKIRIIDTFIPVARGGTYCIPGPFGAGKTVLQQATSRNAEIDIVIIAACGERAGEVVETLREFPHLPDPRTGRTLMERTVIICNTSSMPVAAREASVYTAITLAEYYRQMGLHVLLLADSTSRWAQALREMSGRLEEIPGEEAFPAYLESVIAGFYERAGLVRLHDGGLGSVTIGGTVSPAGGNFDEPVTQSTLKVVGAFHGLSRERSDARKYPAIHPLESWSKYPGAIAADDTAYVRDILFRGNEVGQMMKVVGEEGTSLEDYVLFLKGEFTDSVYLQQDTYDPVDGAVPPERQRHVFALLLSILSSRFDFDGKEAARGFFNQLRQKFLDYNSAPWQGGEFRRLEGEIAAFAAARRTGGDEKGERLWAALGQGN